MITTIHGYKRYPWEPEEKYKICKNIWKSQFEFNAAI